MANGSGRRQGKRGGRSVGAVSTGSGKRAASQGKGKRLF